MKKLVIFLSFAVMFLVVGCQKEDIRPNTADQSVSDSDYDITQKSGDSDDDDHGKPIDTITDPNHDEDEDDKTRR